MAWGAAVLVGPFALHSLHPSVVTAAAFFYDAAGAICHQRPERSFHLAGAQLPVCARCAGLYWSGAAGVLLGWLIGPRNVSARTARMALGIAAIPTALTVALEWLGVAAPSNMVRAAAALPLGLALAALFVSSLRYDRG